MSFPAPKSRAIPKIKRSAQKIRIKKAAVRGSCSRSVFFRRLVPEDLYDCRCEETALRFTGSVICAEDAARLREFGTGPLLPRLLREDVPSYRLPCEGLPSFRLLRGDVPSYRLLCEGLPSFRLLCGDVPSYRLLCGDAPAARRGGEDILALCPLPGEVLLLCRAPDGAFLLFSGVCPAGLPVVVFFNECSFGRKNTSAPGCGREKALLCRSAQDPFGSLTEICEYRIPLCIRRQMLPENVSLLF